MSEASRRRAFPIVVGERVLIRHRGHVARVGLDARGRNLVADGSKGFFLARQPLGLGREATGDARRYGVELSLEGEAAEVRIDDLGTHREIVVVAPASWEIGKGVAS